VAQGPLRDRLMPLSLVPYTSEWTAGARAFNQRLKGAGAAIDFHLGEEASEAHYLIVDGEMVRGGCLVDVERGQVGEEEAGIASIQSPLSEGLFDPQYSGVSPWLMKEIARRWPYSYSVGMGGMDRPYPRLLQALRWRVMPAPFYFRVLDGGRVLRSMPAVSHKKGAALLGSVPLLPSLAFRLLHGWKGRRWTGGRVTGLERVASFEPGETAAWEAVRRLVTFGVSRESEVLNRRYPPAMKGMSLMRFGGGFVILKVTQFTDDRHFGSLRVATWADGLAEPGNENALVSAAEEAAAALKAELLITNQLYGPIERAIKSRGWLTHPSNFLVAWSPPLAKVAQPSTSHITRRDGDGLVHL